MLLQDQVQMEQATALKVILIEMKIKTLNRRCFQITIKKYSSSK